MPKLQPFSPPPASPTMSGSGSKGKWEASCVTEKDVKELREVGYLSVDIAHRLPDKDQVNPTPEPGERVVFIPHFLRARVSPSPLRLRPHVLLWARFP